MAIPLGHSIKNGIIHDNRMDVKTISPLPFTRALFFFGLPLLLMIASFWGLIPLMDLMAVRLFITFLVALGGPMLLLLLLSLRFHRAEGNTWDLQSFCNRFRLKPMKVREWVWTVALAVFLFGTNALFSGTQLWIADIFPQPKFLIRMFDNDPNYFMELPLKGNWFVFSGMLIFVLVNVFGEEFWWRGYIFPRQEIVHGKRTWLIHGLLWSAFHLFMPWQYLQILPGSLALPYVVQRLRNTWPGIIAHFAVNTPLLIQLLPV